MSEPAINANLDTTSSTEPQSSESLPIEQITVFSKLPSELTLEIFSYVDIVSLFRFLDTCRYHRFLLLNLPEIWRRIRFIPLSEYTTLAASNISHTSILAAANSPPTSTEDQASSASGDFSKTTPKGANRRLKHAENERDRDRGGSESLTSEIYAVLRRFRKSNRLVDFVREVYMDGTDSMHFPSPLVMIIKFPQLHVLSSRYRRNQTSIVRETDLLKDMLRNGSIVEHGLQLRRWDIFHPYMTKDEGVVAFKHILDLISTVGKGVALDIKRCPGPEDGATVSKIGGGGSHWATNSAQHPAGVQPQTVTPPPAAPANNDTSNPETTATPPPALTKICANIVWSLEKCRVCEAPQGRCWQCVPICKRCRATRAPPHINHQTALERERQKTAKSSSSNAPPVAQQQKLSEILSPQPQHLNATAPRSLTPPGSISLSQMSNPALAITSAYAYLPPTPDPSPVLAWQSSSSQQAPPQPTLTLPPEFSYFD
ncbi:MAG: hypothetical protein BYD32DRAFT_437280 [Podila humilis]|nr:MAG: hypothetical protein BYD32DRAFT_437280 [Podila humilis]